MTIRFEHSKNIDFAKWDSCIDTSHSPSLTGLSWFLNAVATNWHGLILNDYDAVMPIVSGRKMGINYLFQPAFFQRCAIFSKSILQQDLIDHFYQAIPNTYKLQEFCVDEKSAPSDSVPYNKREKPNLVLPLNSDYESLAQNYSSNTKRNIKKAQKHSLVVTENKNPSFM